MTRDAIRKSKNDIPTDAELQQILETERNYVPSSLTAFDKSDNYVDSLKSTIINNGNLRLFRKY